MALYYSCFPALQPFRTPPPIPQTLCSDRFESEEEARGIFLPSNAIRFLLQHLSFSALSSNHSLSPSLCNISISPESLNPSCRIHLSISPTHPGTPIAISQYILIVSVSLEQLLFFFSLSLSCLSLLLLISLFSFSKCSSRLAHSLLLIEHWYEKGIQRDSTWIFKFFLCGFHWFCFSSRLIQKLCCFLLLLIFVVLILRFFRTSVREICTVHRFFCY